MAAVGAEEGLVHQPQLREQPCKQRQFEDDPHDENQHQEIAHVGVQRDLVDDRRAELVLGQETERKGEDQTVPHGAAQKKHNGSAQKGQPHAAPLVLEERRLHEAPHFEDQVGEHQHQREPERRADVGQELRSDVDIDDLHREIVVAEIGKEHPRTAQVRQPPVEEKIRRRRPQHERIEQVGHDAETRDHEYEQHRHHAEQRTAELLQVAPK